MDIVSAVFELLQTYHLLALFIGTLLLGETIIIPAAFLSAHGFLSPISVFGISLAGALVADSLWYGMGSRLLDWCGKRDWCQHRHKKALRVMERLTGTNPFFYLVLSKFLYGTRIVSIIYVSMRSKKFYRFFAYNALGSAIWLTILITVSWSAGKSFDHIGITLDRIELFVLTIVGVIALFKLLALWANRLFKKI